MDIERAIDDICRSVPGLGGIGCDHTKINKETEANIAYDIATAISSAPFRRGDGGLFFFNGKRYDLIPEKDIKQVVVGVLYKMGIGKVYCFGSVGGIIKLILSDPRIKKFKPSKSIISFNNCMLRMTDMKTFPHTPDLATRIHLDYEYDPSSKCPEWIKFLNYVISDVFSIDVLQEFLGLIFVDQSCVQIESVLLLYGTGGNGKSTALSTIERVVGKEFCSNYEFSQLCTHKNSEYYLSDINGKLLNVASDMSDKDFSGGTFKALAARDPIQVRPINQEPYKATELPLMIASVNKIPHTSDSTDGHWRRMSKIIHFDRIIEEKDYDQTLKNKLLMEIGGIFNWIMDGRRRILSNSGKFTHSDYMKNLVSRARNDSNSVFSFLEEYGYFPHKDIGSTYDEIRILSRDLMKQYRSYCLDYGNTPKSKKGFFDDLTMKKFEYRQTMHTQGGSSTGWILYKRQAFFGSELPDFTDINSDNEEEPELPF